MLNFDLEHWLLEDVRLSERLSIADRRGWRRTGAILLTRSADGVAFIIILGLIFLLGSEVWRWRVLILLLGDLVTFLITQVMKFTIKRPRPEGDWGADYRKIDPHSFPSGHAARGGVMAVLALGLGPWWFAVLLLVWGIGVAFSRVWMEVHFLLDITAGFLVGALTALLILLTI